MNFLQLCQRVRQESGGVAGNTATPTTVVNQIAQLRKIVDWTSQAWVDLQLKHDDWLWKRKQFTLPLVALDNDYAPSDCTPALTDHAEWDLETFRIYLTSAGVSDETFLSKMDYQTWRNVWNIGNQTPTRPSQVTVKPTMNLGFGAVPDAAYTVTGEYLSSAQSMSVDADTPTGLPTEFHMCIVYRALEKYAADEGAPEVYAAHRANHVIMERKLERKQLPGWMTGGALA